MIMAGAVSCAQAVSIVLSANLGTIYKADERTPLPAGSFVSIGYFRDGFDGFESLLDRQWSDLISNDYISVFSPVVVDPGKVSSAIYTTGLEGRQLHIWIFDSMAPPTIIGESAFGLFSGDSDWLARGDRVVPFDQNLLLIDDLVQAFHGFILGSDVALAAIPEGAMWPIVSGVMACLFVLVGNRRLAGLTKPGMEPDDKDTVDEDTESQSTMNFRHIIEQVRRGEHHSSQKDQDQRGG